VLIVCFEVSLLIRYLYTRRKVSKLLGTRDDLNLVKKQPIEIIAGPFSKVYSSRKPISGLIEHKACTRKLPLAVVSHSEKESP